jgi:molybdate transport repressor ModE-like protein
VDRLTDIALFLKVLDLGSISAAARNLDLSVAVASKRLQRLEQELGVRLLHRTTRHVSPTPEGGALAAEGRALVEDLEALTSGLRRAGTEVAGTLRISTSPTFGRLYISPRLPEFLALHPDIKLSIHFSDEMVDLVGATPPWQA